jgi:orotate phosphoribosyltransferase
MVISFPKERQIIRDGYIQMIRETGDFDVIAGTSTAGIPHAAFIAEKMGLPMVYVRGRGKMKDHGKGKLIEGVVKKGDKVAIIEDLISTAESSLDTAITLREAGCKVSHVFAITTYGMEKSVQNLKEHKLKLKTLTTFAETVTAAQKLKLISEDEVKTILEWAKDPSGWGKKQGFE